MEFKVLASGSKGNCTFVTCGTTSFLIDIGITYHRLLRELDWMGVCLSDVSFLLLTHTHRDHISGLSVLLKHSQFRVYIREEMYPELKDILPLDRIEFYQDEMHLNDITLNLIHTSHDAPGSVGFLFTYLEHSLVYITDTGYLNRKYLKLLKNKEIYYMESNHDEKMLMDGPYPYVLKQRILSDVGHLSNETTSEYLQELVGKDTKYVVLAHLSEHNNTEELAYSTTFNKLKETEYHPVLLVAKQEEASELLEV